MTNSERNSASPVITWLGGIDCRPTALRAMVSTTTIRVKLVRMITSDGATDSSVNSNRMTMALLGLRSSPDFVGSASLVRFETSRSMLTFPSGNRGRGRARCTGQLRGSGRGRHDLSGGCVGLHGGRQRPDEDPAERDDGEVESPSASGAALGWPWSLVSCRGRWPANGEIAERVDETHPARRHRNTRGDRHRCLSSWCRAGCSGRRRGGRHSRQMGRLVDRRDGDVVGDVHLGQLHQHLDARFTHPEHQYLLVDAHDRHAARLAELATFDDLEARPHRRAA